MKIFCGIFGVGPSTARKWFYDLNLRTLEDIKTKKLTLTKDQTLGLRYHEDLNKPLLLEEANHIAKLVRETCTALRSGCTVTVVGGFRRGKDKGHDLDLIISHPIEGNEEGMLAMVLEKLDEHFIYTEKKASNTKRQTSLESRSTMDHFEKCFSIFKYRHEGSAFRKRNSKICKI
uniref:DNA-directed DNA polymerase X domain-containing protein n=1 Tax=Ciona savignyi TaxID=51511 RepID=H2ZGS9_CIOSA